MTSPARAHAERLHIQFDRITERVACQLPRGWCAEQRGELAAALRCDPDLRLSWPAIGRMFGCKSHTGIMGAAKRWARENGVDLPDWGLGGRPRKVPTAVDTS